MATRAATFTAKIRNLKDYHYRMMNNLSPLPSGVDIANTLKYFSQTLLSVLKDVPVIPHESYGPRQRDSVRLSVFPNLNYSGVYEAVMNIIEVVTAVQYGQHALGESILNVLACVIPFLEYDLLDTLPYTVASTLAIFPPSLQKETVDLLCTNFLPVTLGYAGMNENPTYARESTAAIMMLVFQYVESGEYHSHILESIMSMKKNVCKDLLSITAYGPPAAKAPAVHHLFHYWPQLNPALGDKRGIHYKYLAWPPVSCQRETCPNHGNTRARKICLDPDVAIQCGEKPPPLFVCIDCVDQLRQGHAQYLQDILQPFEHVSLTCENKNCTSVDTTAVCTCFSLECASLNRFRPMRYCQSCHLVKHGTEAGSEHIFHLTIPDMWSCGAELQSYLVEAIVSLLKEAQPLEEKRTVEMGEERMRQHYEEDDEEETEDVDDRKLLSRYGIWLMVELCTPQDDIPIEVLGRLLAMLFQWFDATAYLPDDNVGNALERLKPDYICKWLQAISKTHFEVILSCLLPHPVEYARVGGHWDTLSSRTSQIKEGLNRLCCLIPYDIVVFEVWDYVIPFWLEAIRTEVPEDERHELKVLLCKVFDIDMSPLPFSADKMYHFIAERFENTTSPVQEQNLQWLQILTALEIYIPLHLLLEMLRKGVDSLANPPLPDDITPGLQSSIPPNVAMEDFPPGSPLTPPAPEGNIFNYEHREALPEEENIPNITCFIMMLDLVIKQVELQETTAHLGIYNETCKELLGLLANMLNVKWEGSHTCDEEGEITNCSLCEVSALWHQLASRVMTFIAPRDELKLPEKDLPKVDQRERLTSRRLEELTRTLEEEAEPNFNIDRLPIHLQLLFAMLKDLDLECDADALYWLLKSMKLLCLHAECLNYTVNEHEDFVKFCLKKMLLPNLWKLLQAEHSQIATMCVPLLLHCITLPSGADIFWQTVEDEFNNEDWRARFSAVEKTTVLARLIEPTSIHRNQQIMTSLAHAFCSLIGSLNDINSAVVQRTMVYLETIKETSVQCMCQCLEFQFDSVINDRSMILQRLHLLSVVLKDRDIFNWDFFLNRFDTLCLEAQLDLESSGDIACLTDLHSSDRQSDSFLRKINRARFAMARTDSIRSVSGSLFMKVPYRRAASVPMHLLAKTLPNTTPAAKEKWKMACHKSHWLFNTRGLNGEENIDEKEKSYTRQQSAPQFGRSRGSRFGLTMFSNYMFPGGHLREFTDEESNFAALLQRAMDLEGVDRETLHQLVALLMKQMVHSDQGKQKEERNLSGAQGIVLRHMNVLLGYNPVEKCFNVPPYKLRYSVVFNAFISGLPQVLDKNFELGNIILPVSMALLQYSPSPQRYASDYQPPNYTLWYLEPHTRQSWLSTLLVILYKYQYNTSPASGMIQFLVQVVINTIAAQIHRCKKPDDAFGPSTPIIPRNRDTSNVSIGDLENILETETPPQSPTSDSQQSGGETVTISMTSPSGTTVQYRKRGDDDTVEDTDTESLEPSSKATSPMAKVTTPLVGRGESPPRPSSPTATSPERSVKSRSQTPLHYQKPFGSSHGKPKPPPRVSSPTEAVAQFSREQPRRIAEYNRNSMGETDDRPIIPSKPMPPLVRQMTEPDIKYNPFQQRTLEQSVEQFMLEQVGAKPQTTLPGIGLNHSGGGSNAITALQQQANHSPREDVDRKIAEQLQLFESQSDGKKKVPVEAGTATTTTAAAAAVVATAVTVASSISATRSSTDTKFGVAKELSPAEHSQLQGQGQHSVGTFEKRFESLTIKSTVLEEVKESEEEWDSPKKVPLIKTRSEEIQQRTLDLAHTPEFAGVKPRSERSLSERSESELEKVTEGMEQTESELDDSPCTSPAPTLKLRPNFRQRKARKTGLTTVELQKMIPELGDFSSTSSDRTSSRRSRRSELINKSHRKQQKKSQATLRFNEQILVDRCPDCGMVLEQYDEDTISDAIVCLATFIHREPALSAPLLLDMLQSVARIAASNPYPWQAEISGLVIPGNSVSVARQFMRCSLHQLAPNGIFPQVFQTELEDPDFLKTMASALVDFPELNCHSALQLLLEGTNDMKSINSENMMRVIDNLAVFMDYLAVESSSPAWNSILTQFDIFFRRLPGLLPNPCDIQPLLKIMIHVLKIPGLTSVKAILEPFSKVLSFTIQNCSFKLQQLSDICSLCSRAFSKERDKLYLPRTVVFELVQALKFKTSLPDDNLLRLVQFVCVDAGGTIGPNNIIQDMSNYTFNPYMQSLISTNASDCMKQHLNECVEFVVDIHTINKVKNNLKGGDKNLNEDTLGSQLKAAISQYIALEFTKGNGRDNRAISRYLPWLYHPPSTMQQGPREFIDCVGHIRLLSWLLLGSLTHSAITKLAGPIVCQPLPLECSSFIADHIMVIMTGFADQSKASVLHMSSLFHAFILCQLWTMYCESYVSLSSQQSELYSTAHSTIMDFWARVTPGVLQLLSHSKVLAEMVNLHFLGLMEALQECNSMVLSRLFPMWTPILFSYHSQLPGHMQVRLQMCQNWQPKDVSSDGCQLNSDTLQKWLKRLQFKLGQIEVQSSAATQFYTV